jgi:hypothetical protein
LLRIITYPAERLQIGTQAGIGVFGIIDHERE